MKRAQRRELQKLAKTTTSIELAQMLDRCEPGGKEFMHLVALMKHYQEQLRRTVREQPEGVAMGLHQLVDQAVAHTNATSEHGKDVSCRKGCNHCCKLPMHILKAEALLALHHAREHGIKFDVDRLRRQRGHTFKDWQAVAIEDRTCVFLAQDGTCSIYEVRPSVCRKYQVINPPEHCDTIQFYGHRTAKLVSPDAEAAVSSAMNYHAHGPMADMLLEAMDSTKEVV